MKKLLIIIFLLSFGQLFGQQITGMGEGEDAPLTTSSSDPGYMPRSGKQKTSTGTLRILVLFINYSDDNISTSYWAEDTDKPTWSASLVNSSVPGNNIFTPLSISDFFNRSSGGDANGHLGSFTVIGDCYGVTVDRPTGEYKYNNGKAIEAALAILDSVGPGGMDVDFSLYDNWNFCKNGVNWVHENNADGIIDQMFVFYKHSPLRPSDSYGGYSYLDISTFQTNDGVDIPNNSGSCVFNTYNRSLIKAVSGAAHEYGHWLFGNGQVRGHWDGENYKADQYGNKGRINKFALMSAVNQGWMNGLEKYLMGWLEPDIITSANSNYTLGDTHVTGDAFILPISYNNGRLYEYYFVENFHNTNDYSAANPFLIKVIFSQNIYHGLLVYHVKSTNYDFEPNSYVSLESADGKWNWKLTSGGSTPTNVLDDYFDRSEPSYYTGYTDLEFIAIANGSYSFDGYVCLTKAHVGGDGTHGSGYYKDSFLGENADLFRENETPLFNRYTNPAAYTANYSPTNFGFEIKSYNSSTKEYLLNIQTTYAGVLAMPPSKPQLLQITVAPGRHPKLTWFANTEPDISWYQISRKVGSAGWQIIGYVYHPTTNYTDSEVTLSSSSNSDDILYKVRAVDNTAKYSLYSDEASCKGIYGILPKSAPDGEKPALTITEMKLLQNYPNPFNPTTEISYKLKEPGFVKITVYNSIGEEVGLLVSEFKPAGQFKATFNAENLPSGIYYYEMRTGNFRETKKMLLLR